MTIGQVTFEAVQVSVFGRSADQARFMWNSLEVKDREAWETAGETVEAYYETGIEGAR